MSYQRVQVRNNSFSRATANEMKMGAYYTDPDHCSVIGQLFKFPDDEVSVLEPSIGDGTAVKCVTDKANRDNVKIFGVELNDSVATEVKSDPMIQACVSADFTNGVNIRNNAFSFCFGNPPYMDDDDTEDGKRGRLERTFLELVTQRYLKIGGILVWVIPYRIFADNSYFRYLLSRYETLGVWKFWPEEYSKWHQVVFVGRKIPTRVCLADTIAAEYAKYATDDMVPTLPRTFKGTELYESIEVNPSSSDEITLFAPRAFDVLGAVNFLSTHKDAVEDYSKAVSRKVTQKEYTSSDLGRPPIMPKPDSLYLMATSGAGQGMAGTLGKDAHLQRGIAEVIEESVVTPNPSDPETDIVTVTTRTKVSMTIMETGGKITTLE